MAEFLEAKIATLGTSACPPYHLALVVGGLSAEQVGAFVLFCFVLFCFVLFLFV
jgi:tartrate dehydratase alpha subunit/fumarate hydratase class I-like protein